MPRPARSRPREPDNGSGRSADRRISCRGRPADAPYGFDFDIRGSRECSHASFPPGRANHRPIQQLQYASCRGWIKIRAGQTFNPFADDVSFLLGAYIFEDVGVTAYNGAAPLIQSKTYLGAAASILAVEAYHAGNIRTVLFEKGQGPATAAISAVRAALSGANDDHGVVMNGLPNITPTDVNALAFSRTTTQVLNIVYAGGASGNYGFFRKDYNGAIA